MTKKTKRLLTSIVVTLLVVAAGAAAYVWFPRGEKGPAGPTVQVTRGSLRETAAASGKIEPAVQVEVKSRVAGEVVEILVKEGDVVEAGQLLLRLDKTQALQELDAAKVARSRAQADLASAQASLKVAELDKENNVASQALADKSVELGLGSSDAARIAGHTTQVSVANINLKKAQSNASALSLKTAEIAVQDAETNLKYTDIYAPIAGTVLSLTAEKGTMVSSAFTNVSGGSAILTIADLSDLRIIGSIDEAQISRVQPEQLVEIRVEAYPDRVFSGVVDRVSALGVETSSVVTFDVEVKVVDEAASLLRSGMSADVEIVTAEQKDVLLVPLAAVSSKGKKRFVRTVSGEEKPIDTGATDGTQMIVRKGLDEGEAILASAPAPATTGGPQQGQRQGGGQMRGMGMGMGAPRGGGR